MTKTKESRLRPLDPKVEKRRKSMEGCASFGLILIAAGLLIPFASLTETLGIEPFKWVFAAGAVIYTIARVVNVNDPKDSRKLRSLRRMEAWAGFSFCIAAFLWFYREARIPQGGLFYVLRDTVTFALVGAVLQIVASWLIASRDRKERTLVDNEK